MPDFPTTLRLNSTTETHLTRESIIQKCLDTLRPLDKWARDCHGASLHIVREAEIPPARVARGFCAGVGAQHSWVVLGMDCYDDHAVLIDPTLWSYDDSVEGIWTGTYLDGLHEPHGAGNIFQWGRPDSVPKSRAFALAPSEPFSDAAQAFLDLLGPLDERGWAVLAHAPVEGWPAHEILPAIADAFPAVVPIDILGMATDRNPNGLYLRGGK